MTSEHPGEVPDYMDTFKDFSGLLGHYSITLCRNHRFEAEVYSTRSLIFAIWTWPVLGLNFRNNEIGSGSSARLRVSLTPLLCVCIIEVRHSIVSETFVEQDRVLNGREF